ncbi:MAG: hypothetical protein RL326_670 [Pseudomonadota bacterium]|jgi:hypothetical protein
MKEQHELDPIACFLSACEIERREHRSAGREHKVVQGRRTIAESGRVIYSFRTQGDLPFKEFASVQLITSLGFYAGTVLGRGNGAITLAVSVDLGPVISSARLEGEEGDVLQTLITRLKALKSADSTRGFNRDLALQTLRLPPTSEGRAADHVEGAPEDLTRDQRDAFEQALSRQVTFLWGPPGTGKTRLLGALAWYFYKAGKRVLIASHTNQAVDGVVESLCARITERGRSSIPEGTILRLGSMVKESTIRRFGEQVQLDRVMHRSHEKVSSRLDALKSELCDVRNKLFETSKKLSLLDSYADLHGQLQKLRSELKGDESGLKHVVRRVFQSSDALHDEAPHRQQELRESISLLESNLTQVTAELQGCERQQLAELSLELSHRQLEITEAIAMLEKFMRDLRLSLLDRARIVATTASRALISAADLSQFDVVLIDEASMLPLPLSFVLSGYARDRVVIAGDFRQLPSVALSDSHMVRHWYTRDIFECAGVVDVVDAQGQHPAIATLTTQFRSNATLCGLINERFYGGLLRTVEAGTEHLVFREPLTYLNRYPVVLVDTSPLAPLGQTTRNSKSNLQHALLCRKIALSLNAAGLSEAPDGVGVIAPYRPQVSLIRELLDECGLAHVSSGTVHRFQGSERRAIILDLTDSPPHTLGTFLRPTSLRDTGARLLNVALSRARDYLFVVANLSHLRAQLSSRHLLSGILDDIERTAYPMRVDELIGEPLPPDVARGGTNTTGVFVFQSFDEVLFLPALVADLLEASNDVVVSSETLTPRVAQVLSTVLRERIQRGLRVTFIVGGTRSLDDVEQRALRLVREAGALVIKALRPPEPFVVVDSEVVWLGSMVPGDCLGHSEGIMTRSVSRRAASLLLEQQGGDATVGAAKTVSLG